MRYILASTKIIKGKCSYPYNIIKKTTFYKKWQYLCRLTLIDEPYLKINLTTKR